MSRALSDLTLQELMALNITDNRATFEITEDEFKKIFVEFSDPKLKEIETNLSLTISEREYSKKYLFFAGKAGVGKSTFLYFFFKNNTSIFNFDIINLQQYPAGINDEKLIRDNIYNKIINELSAQLNSHRDKIEKLCEHAQFEPLMDSCFDTDIEGYNKKTAEFKGLLKALSNPSYYAIGFEDNLKNKIHTLLFKKQGNKFVFLIQDVIMMFLIIKTICLIPKDNEKKKIVFCIDNLDSFSQHYLSVHFLKNILNWDTYLSDLFKQVFEFNFKEKAHFLLALRSLNLNLLKSTIGIDTTGRIKGKYEVFSFENKDIDEILEKRLNIEIIPQEGESTIKRINVIKSIMRQEDPHNKNTMLFDLFDENKRDFMQALELITNRMKPYALNLKSGAHDYERISQISIEGARGIVLNSLLRFFDSDDSFFIKKLLFDLNSEIEEEKSDCSPYRMLMTIIANFQENDTKITLLNICKEIIRNNYISIDNFCDFISNFYDPLEDHSLLLIIKNSEKFDGVCKKIRSERYLLTEKEKIKSAIKKWHNNQNGINGTFLNSYSILPNSAIISCVKYVYIHYEYFNFLNYKNNTIPLFQSFDLNMDTMKYKFEEQIPQIFSFVEKFINKIDNSFVSKYCSGEIENSIDVFTRSNVAFNNTMYCTRILNQFITYIDKFRYYLFENRKKIEANSKKFPMLANKGSQWVQQYLITQINNLIKLFYEDIEKKPRQVKEGSKDSIFKKLSDNAKIAKQYNYKDDFFHISKKNIAL